MNIKISENSVTFKITKDELDSLSNGKAIENFVSIGGNIFTMVINADTGLEEHFKDIKEAPLKLIFDKGDSCLMLFASKEQIHYLVDMGRSKQGLSFHVNGLDIFLQVDLRSDNRPSRSHQ